MAGSIAKQPWRLGVIIFLLAAFVVGLLLVQSFAGNSTSGGVDTQVTAGSIISSETANSAATGQIDGGQAGAGAMDAGGSAAGDPFISVPALSTVFATYTAAATPAEAVSPAAPPHTPGIPPDDTGSGSISGTVFEQADLCGDGCETSAQRLGNITVYLADAARNLTGRTASTDSAGQFRFDNLAPGKYNLFFSDPTGDFMPAWYIPQTIIAGDSYVLVVASQDTGITMSMMPAVSDADTGGIAGRVSDTSGAGIAGVTVMAYRVDEAVGGLLSLENLAVTDSGGGYHITDLPAGPVPGGDGKLAGYKILFSPAADSGYSQQWYEDQPTHTTAKLINPLPGEELTGIDAILDGSGTISGRVFGDTYPLAGVNIDIFDTGGAIVSSHVTDAKGGFVSGPLTTGTYRVRASAATGFVDEWYNNADSFATADPIVVVSGTETSGIVISLEREDIIIILSTSVSVVQPEVESDSPPVDPAADTTQADTTESGSADTGSQTTNSAAAEDPLIVEHPNTPVTDDGLDAGSQDRSPAACDAGSEDAGPLASGPCLNLASRVEPLRE